MNKIAMWPFSSNKYELAPETDDKKLKALSALANKFARYTQPGTAGQLLFMRDKNNPALMTEWTVASDPTDDYTDADEWKLIANGYKTLDKIKENALLIALEHAQDGTVTGTGYTGDQITPKGMVGGVPIKQLFFNSTPIDMGYTPTKEEVDRAEEAQLLAELGKKASASTESTTTTVTGPAERKSYFVRGNAPELLGIAGLLAGAGGGYLTSKKDDSAVKKLAKTIAGSLIGGLIGYGGGWGLTELSRLGLGGAPYKGSLKENLTPRLSNP